MNDIYNIFIHPNKKRKMLIVFDDMIAEMLINPIANDLFIRGRKLNIFHIIISQSYFAVPKNIRLNSTHYFIMKTPNRWELQQIAFNRSSAINTLNELKIFQKKFENSKKTKMSWQISMEYKHIICGYFCIEFVDFMLKGKSLLDSTNLFSLNEFEKNDKIIPKYFQ